MLCGMSIFEHPINTLAASRRASPDFEGEAHLLVNVASRAA